MADEQQAPEVTSQPAAPAPASPEPTSAPDAPAAQEGASPDAEKPAEPKPETKPERLLSQEEVNRIVRRERRAAEDRAYTRARLEAENERLRAQLGQPRGDTPNATPGNGEKPKPDQFKDWDTYQEALTDWKVDQKLTAAFQGTRKQAETAVREEYAQTVRTKLAEGVERYDDFEEALTSPGVVFTDAMVDAVINTSAPADVAYFLGTHPKESQRIGALSLAGQVLAIRELADKLAKPSEPTKAPDPIKPTSGSGGATATLVSTQNSYKDWVKLRNRELGRT